nr:glycosyltransferase [Pedobacter sp. ASV2]
MIKVSICIPTYKQLNFLAKTLDSITIQNYKDYEIIITDDTPDNSVLELLNTYDFEDRLKYHKNEITLGSPKNWNKAVSLAEGQYIKIMHHDDYFSYAYSLRKFVEMLDNNPQSDFAFSASITVDISKNDTWVQQPSKKQLEYLSSDPLAPFFGNFIGPPSSTIYRNKKQFCYDENLTWLVDLDFYIKNLQANKHYQYTSATLITGITGTEHNVTTECINNKEVEIREYLYLYKKIYTPKIFFRTKFLIFFIRLFNRYKISSAEELREIGTQVKLPQLIKLALICKSLIHTFKGEKSFKLF